MSERSAIEAMFRQDVLEGGNNAIAQELKLPDPKEIITALKPHLFDMLERREKIFEDKTYILDPTSPPLKGYLLILDAQVREDGDQVVIEPQALIGRLDDPGRAGPTGSAYLSREALVTLLRNAFPEVKERKRVMECFMRVIADQSLPNGIIEKANKKKIEAHHELMVRGGSDIARGQYESVVAEVNASLKNTPFVLHEDFKKLL